MLFFRSGRALSVAVLLSLSLTGCSSFVASTTGAGPVGVVSGDRSFAQIITDNGIVKTAEINLYKLDPRFNFSRVNISSFHSVVLLTGQVPDGYLKQLAEHGLTAETVIDGLEDAEDYCGFEAAVIADYDARTAVERELVLRLASLLWRLRRIISIETDLIQFQAVTFRLSCRCRLLGGSTVCQTSHHRQSAHASCCRHLPVRPLRRMSSPLQCACWLRSSRIDVA